MEPETIANYYYSVVRWKKSANQSASEQSLTIDEWILTQLPDNVKQYYINLIIME